MSKKKNKKPGKKAPCEQASSQKEKTLAQKFERPNWAKEFLKYKKNRPQQIINMAKEMGYLKKKD